MHSNLEFDFMCYMLINRVTILPWVPIIIWYDTSAGSHRIDTTLCSDPPPPFPTINYFFRIHVPSLRILVIVLNMFIYCCSCLKHNFIFQCTPKYEWQTLHKGQEVDWVSLQLWGYISSDRYSTFWSVSHSFVYTVLVTLLINQKCLSLQQFPLNNSELRGRYDPRNGM